MIPDSEIKVEYFKGSGPGGRHRNSTNSCVRMTHIPTGITVTIDGRKQHSNYHKARKELELRISAVAASIRGQKKKARRDEAIKNTKTVRTYDFQRGTVKDHRTGKQASIKDVLDKGKIDLLR
jgi:peptide chain release factor 1